MAKNRIEIDVIVDDAGTTKKVGLGAAKAGDGLDRVAKSAGEADRNIKGVGQQSSNATKNFSKMSQGMGGLVSIYATIAAQVFAVSAAFNFFKGAADLRVLRDSQIAYSSATGLGMLSLTKNIKAATDGMVSFKDAAQAAAIGAASGLDISQIQNLATGAKNVSMLLGRDVTDSFNRLIRGVTKAEPELLDELGITLRLADAQEKYAATLKKSARDLTIYEKSQAIALDVQDQLDKKYNSVAAAVQLESNAVAQLGIAFEKVTHPIMQFINDMVEPSAEFMTKNIKALTAALGLLAVPILKMVIPGLNNWAETAQTSAMAAKEAISSAKQEIEELARAQVALKASGQDPAQLAKDALSGIKSKSSGIQKLQSGVGDLTDREIKGLLNAAEKGKGAVTGMSNEMKRQYIAALREMAGKSSTTGTKIAGTFKGVQQQATLSFKRIGAEYDLLMARMKKATATFSKFANRAMKLAGLIGVLLMLKDIAVAIGESLGFFKVDKAIEDMIAGYENVTSAIEDAKKEFRDFAKIQEDFYAKNNGFGGKQSIESMKAIGNYMASIKAPLEEYLRLEQSRLGITDKIIGADQKKLKLQNDLAIIQDRINNLNPKRNKTSDDRKQLEVAREERNTLKAELRKLGNDTREEVKNLASMSSDVSEPAEEARNKVIDLANAMKFNLKAARIEAQEGGTRFLELLDKMSKTGTLAQEDAAEFEKLRKKLQETGGEAATMDQKFSALNLTMNKKIAALTQFQTSVTKDIEDAKAQLDYYQNGQGKSLAEAATRIKQLTKDSELLQKIHEGEVGLELRKLRIQKETNALTLGATDRQKRHIETAKTLATIESDRLKLLNDIQIASTAGVTYDQAKAEQLLLQLDILEQQEAVILRQNNIVLDLMDKMNNEMESSFEKNLTDLITGAEKSFTSFVSKIATDALTAGAKRLSSSLTDAFFGKKQEESPEAKIKKAMTTGATDISVKMENAMKMGADYHGRVILAAMKGETVSSPASVASTYTSTTKESGTTTPTVAGVPATKAVKAATGWFDDLLGTGRGDKVTQTGADANGVEGVQIDKAKGSLSNFLGSLGDIFDKNAEGGFMEKLSIAFEAGSGAFADLFKGLGNMLGDLFGGMFGGSSGGGIGGFIMSLFANGGIATGGFRAFASGGTVNKPTIGLVGEGKYNEAVVPLPDGKSIPVQMGGMAGGTNNVTVNVNVSDSGSSMQQEGNSGQAGNLGKVIAMAVQQELQNQKRSGGILNPYGVA